MLSRNALFSLSSRKSTAPYATFSQDQAQHFHVPAILHLGLLVCEHGNLSSQHAQIQGRANRSGLWGFRDWFHDFAVLCRLDRRSLLCLGKVACAAWVARWRGSL